MRVTQVTTKSALFNLFRLNGTINSYTYIIKSSYQFILLFILVMMNSNAMAQTLTVTNFFWDNETSKN